ncbi:hypothetical protein AB1N83_014155, partial [Pleurotus pulmonarius]
SCDKAVLPASAVFLLSSRSSSGSRRLKISYSARFISSSANFTSTLFSSA